MQEDEPPLYSAEWFRWVEGKYLGDDYLKPRTKKQEAPKPGIWEGRPAYWKPGEAWAFIEGRWDAVNSSDVGMNARPVTAEQLAEIFPDTPPLPGEAFRR